MPTILLTGANRGLGLEFVRQYDADGWRIHACARDPESAADLKALAEKAAGRITLHEVDIADFAAIDAVANRLRGTPIDVLLNCAGWMGSRSFAREGVSVQQFGGSDFKEWESVFRVNTFAPMKMAEAFVDHVLAGEQKKIVSLTSIMASIAKNTIGGFYQYRASKAALNAIMRSMAIDLGKRGIVAIPIHPGWVRTDMGGPKADIDAHTSVTGMRKVIAGLTAEQAGRYWTYEGKELPW
ncbi:MAG TPA: SDR family oxidoreductase [Steroidobacteraceae bacterium]|nr:SDR family oxidoreductase [Steroidobacteraceae bacterium]